MPPTLRPATVEALASFRKRRTRLLIKRAGIAALIVLLLLLLVVALLDRATFMPDGLRSGLSYLCYVIAAIAAWRQALRFVKEADAEEGAAKLLEIGDPALHEKLLSAVELSHQSRENDSEEFRAKLQDEVAARLTGFNPESVLPNSLLRPWIAGLCGVGVLMVLLSFIPGLHLPGFMARAVLPFANIGRPSSTKVRIVLPAKPDALVPIASSVPVGVQIEGKMPKRVLVETMAEGGKPSRMELSSAGANRFDGSIGIGQNSVRYRFLAGDAVTAWHTLDARPRPRIIEFVKTITPPAYTGLQEQSLTEDHGDVSALDGSTVKLALKPNQPISESAATLLPDAAKLSIATDDEGRLSVTLPVNGKSDSWQFSLKSKETGFGNEESSPWRIETLPDMPPTIVITAPREQMEVQADDIVQIVGNATDDIGLAKIELSYAINAAGWKAGTLSEKAGKEAPVASPFKLAPLPVKTGDSVLVKLIATDVKGQTAESAPVRLFIVENKLNLAQREWAAQQRLLAAQAKALNEEMRDLRKESERVRATDKQKQRGREQEEADAALAKMKQRLAGVQEKSQELWDKLKQAAQHAPDALKAMDANLAGQKLAAMRGQHLKELQEQAHAEKMDERQLKEAASRAANDAEQVAEALRAFAAEDTAEAVRESMEHLAPQQNRLADKAMDANRNADERPKWQEQQRAALAAAKNTQQDLEALKEVIRSDRQRDVNNHIENFAKKMPALEASLDKPQQAQSPEYVYGQSHEMRNAVNQARDASRWFADEAAQRANEQRDRLMQQPNPALAAIDQARDQANQAANQNPKKPQPANEEPRQQQAADKLTAAARQMKDQSELREQNHQTNNQTALDQNRMGRALENLAEQMRHAKSPEQMKQVAEKAKQLGESARALEADAKAQDAATSLQQAQEAAMSQTQPAQQLAAARAAASQLKELPRALRQAQSNNESANAAQEAANHAQAQRDETQNQQRAAAQMKQNGQQPPNIPAEHNNAIKANATAQQKLEESMSQFAPKVAEARQQLEAMTPKLSELAKNAAENVKQSQQQTEQVAQAAQNNQPAEKTAQDANALLPKAGEDAQKLADLQAALRQEADKADLNNEAQRQMARTADVGLAQMRQQTPQIAQNLQQATKAPQAQEQAKALQDAAKAQQQTAQGLEQLSQNLAKMEQGQMLAEDALAAQQAMEESLGIKQPLDEAYKEAQNLAELMEKAQDDPQQALKALEQELKKNAQMQRALGVLAEQTAQESQQALNQTKDQPAMAQPAQEQEGHALARVARHEERLDQKPAAQQIAQASQQIQQMAKAAKTDPGQNTPEKAQQAAQAAQKAQQAAAEAAKAQAANTPGAKSFLDAAKGAMLAQALDKIDQSLNPSAPQMQQGQQQPQPGQQDPQQGQPQPGQQQSAQEQAKQNLAQAGQAQAQSMAQARAQGMVPGQQPQQQQTAQQGKNQDGPSQASQDATGNLSQTQAQLLVPVLAVEQGGDWGHLPSRMAKDLTEASRQELSPEYRAAIESYYKAIAEKAKR